MIDEIYFLAKIVLVLYAFLVAASRILRGMHSFIDVFGGLLMGALTGTISFMMMSFIPHVLLWNNIFGNLTYLELSKSH